jgi:XRE family transcriptional regulator, regulator of sulfur utilization
VAEKLDAHTRKVLVSLGKHVREARARQNVPQADLARRIGMEPTNLGKIERGQKNVTVDTLVRIAAGLGTGLRIDLAPAAPARRRGAGAE